MSPFIRNVLLLLCLVLATGCASIPYDYDQNLTNMDLYYPMPEGESQIERGKPYPVMDTVASILEIPVKILLLNWRVGNHDVSPETEETIREYLAANGLKDVKVRLNQYSPGAEWKRTYRSRHIHWFWRHTLGFVAWLGYTAFPDRIFPSWFLGSGDHYNPYSNTINIYSDVPAIALHEGGHAKDTAERKLKGTHAALYVIPFVPLYYEAVATSDAISYARAEKPIETEKDEYKILYPAYGTYAGGSFGQFLTAPYSYAVYGVGIVCGHIVGRTKAALLKEPRESEAKTGN